MPDTSATCVPLSRRGASVAAAIALLTSLAIADVPSPGSAERTQSGRSMALDHVVLAVNDLDAMAARYRQFGFALKPGRPHANGIRNQHVKFTDGTELELLTAPEERDALTRRYRRHLAQGDGPAFLSLWPKPAPPPRAAAPDYIFFGQGNRSPTDRPEHFAHANTAERLSAVWLAGSDFARERLLLSGHGAVFRRGRLEALGVDADVATISGGRSIYLLPASHRLHDARPVVGVTFAVGDIVAARRWLQRSGVAVGATERSVVLGPTIAGGLWVELRGR